MRAEPHTVNTFRPFEQEDSMHDWCDDIEMELELAAMLADPFDSYV